MSIIATAVKHLLAAGVTGDALVTAIEEMEECHINDKLKSRTKYKINSVISQKQWQQLRERALLC